MFGDEKKNNIILEMNKKKIKSKYQKNILKYLEMNFELFPYIDTEIIIERILNNFAGVSLNFSSIFYHDYGQYIPTTGKILLSPNLFFGKNRKLIESVFYHELDHCACAPVNLKQKFDSYKNDIKNKYKFFYKIMPDFILSEIFLKIYYEGPISGVANLKQKKGHAIQKLLYGTKLENYLNEGITSLKQKIYSEKLNIAFHKKNDFLYGVRLGAQCVADTIGFDNMINCHFFNNLEKIKKDFFKKTEIKLEELILKCIIYDQKRTKKTLKDLKKFIEIVNKKVNI